jgi:hypothetical protein
MSAHLNQLLSLLIRTGYPDREKAAYLDIACIGAMFVVHAIAIAPADHRQSMVEVLTDYIREQTALTE